VNKLTLFILRCSTVSHWFYITRKTVLYRGSRSDRPRYCVTTRYCVIRSGYWPL